MALRSASISSKCTGMIRGRCEGRGVETPELPGPLLREGKVETGLVPNARRPGPGSSADTSKCSSTCSPSLRTPACQTGQQPPTPPASRRVSLSRSSAPGLPPQSEATLRLQSEDTGPLPQGGHGAVVAPCARSPPCPAPLSLHLAAGGGLWVFGRSLGPINAGADPGLEVPPRCVKLGPPGGRREQWVHRCEGLSALGMHAGDGGTQFGDPVHWPLAVGVQMGLPALS